MAAKSQQSPAERKHSCSFGGFLNFTKMNSCEGIMGLVTQKLKFCLNLLKFFQTSMNLNYDILKNVGNQRVNGPH